jgi:CO/xanthine dehydrogenase Mo-binding subunit
MNAPAPAAPALPPVGPGASTALPRPLRLWVDFALPGRVRLRPGKVELGQGIVSAIAQIAAEELDVALECVELCALDTRVSPNEGSTTGSRSIQEGGEGMRRACAEVRALFAEAAARRLGVAAAELQVVGGRFGVPGAAASLSYWELADGVDLERPISGAVAPKPPRSFKLVGTSQPRLDIPAKLRGGSFIQDIELPGTLHGRVVRPPAARARLVSLDEGPTRALPGVRAVVRENSFVAVIAQREEQAVRAWRQLSQDCRWETFERLPDEAALPGWICSRPTETEVLVEGPAAPATAGGLRLEAQFSRPYIAHASIAPSCGLAWWRPGQVEVWSHSQSNFELRNEIARVLGRAPDEVVVRHAEAAGCYGHNGADDAAFDAVLLARAVPGEPVRVQWMREDEFAWEPLGPAAVVKLAATVRDGHIQHWDEQIIGNRHIGRPGRMKGAGLLAAWHAQDLDEPPLPVDMPAALGGGSQRNAVPYYDFPMRVVNRPLLEAPLRVSALRALGAHLNVFAIESFIDELAQACGADPVAFRLQHLSDERSRAVIEHAARRAGWVPGRQGDGSRGWGMAFSRYKNTSTYAAVFAEVELTEQVRVTRIVAAVDCGCIVNPDGLLNQCEGGVIQALSWTLKEQVRFNRGAITSLGWAEYPILAFSDVPPIEIELIDRRDEPSLGAGEGMTGPTAAAVGNAIFNAMGVRVRDLPLSFERIAAAM